MDEQVFQHPAHCARGGFINIRPGDTLTSLASRYNTTVQAIVAANPGINPNNLPVNQLICIPTPGQIFPGICPNAKIYMIKPGDTVYSVARRFDIPVNALLAANPGINPNSLRIGQTICVPEIPTPTITCPGPTYTVRPGDTLSSIARTLGLSVQNILAANPGINPNSLGVGQILCLPTGGTVPCPGGTIYRVKLGETLYGIARRFDIAINRILRANPGLSVNTTLHPGQPLCIPIREI